MSSERLLSLALGLTVLAGCAVRPGGLGPHPDGGTSLVWPSPPDPARVVFWQVIDEPTDLVGGGGALSQLRDLLAGAPPERLVTPAALAVDDRLGLAVADIGIPGVHLFDWVHGRHRILTGGDDHPLRSPVGVAFGPARAGAAEVAVWVSDSERASVIVFSADGTVLREISDPDRLLRPAGLVVDAAAGVVTVVDVLAHDLKQYDLEGRHLRSFGSQGAEAGQFNYPTHLTRLADGGFAVTDSLNFRVQVLDSAGAPRWSVGRLGDAPGCLSRPKGVAADRDGNLWIVDALFENVQAFDPTGALLLHVGGPGRRPGEFWLPSGLAIDSHSRMWIADAHNHRIQVFELRPGAPEAAP